MPSIVPAGNHKDPADFWRRWHISLSIWFRDYLYIPLGGSRHGQLQISIPTVLEFSQELGRKYPKSDLT